MPRGLILAAVFVSSACGAIWPDHLGPYQRKSTAAFPQPQSEEYGFEAAERADYGPFQVTAWRFKDTTGSYAASLLNTGLRVGNYLVRCEGDCPKNFPQLADASLPHVSHA